MPTETLPTGGAERPRAPVYDDYPPPLATFMRHVADSAPEASGAWVASVALAAWSALLPATCRVAGVPPSVWALGVAERRASGLAAADEALATARAVLDLGRRAIAWYTGGPAEGLARQVQGRDTVVVAHLSDAPALFRHARQFPAVKPFLADLAAGRSLGHYLGTTMYEAQAPYVVCVGTTPLAGLAEYTQPDDLDGYLAGFLLLQAEDNGGNPAPLPDLAARGRVALRLFAALDGVAQGEYALTPQARLALARLPAEAGLAPGGDAGARLVLRGARRAALVAAARGSGTVTGPDAHLVTPLLVRGEEDRRAIAERLRAVRAALVVRRVAEKLAASPEPLTARLLQLQTHQPATAVAVALDELMRDKRVEAERAGQTWHYRPVGRQTA